MSDGMRAINKAVAECVHRRSVLNAAAPQMLEALKAVAYDVEDDDVRLTPRTIRAVREAIAAATGGNTGNKGA